MNMATEKPESPHHNLSSPSIIKAEIHKRLSEDGLNPQSTEEEKLFYVWRLFSQTEADLQASVENEDKLRQSQAEEMEEVENYVEHIRNLSDERETLIQELEAENDQLKGDIEQLKQDEQAGARAETEEMLMQQGLVEISNATTSEQIAYLLVERARLLDELEAEQNKSMNSMTSVDTTPNPDSNAIKVLERERDDIQEELQKHCQEENRLKLVHDEEINTLMEENEKLEEELAEHRLKISNLVSELETWKTELENEKELRVKEKDANTQAVPVTPITTRPPSPARSSSDLALRKIIMEKTQIEAEIVNLRGSLKPIETENESLKENITDLESKLEESKMLNYTLQMKNKSIQSELVQTENKTDSLERKMERLTRDRADLEKQLEASKEELGQLQDQYTQQQQELLDLQSSLQLATSEKFDLEAKVVYLTPQIEKLTSEVTKLNQQVDDLNSQAEKFKEELKTQANKHHETTETLTSEKEELTSKLEDLEKELEKVKVNSEKEVHNEACKLEAVSTERQKLYSQLQETQKELKDAQNREQALLQDQESLSNTEKTMESRYKQDTEDLKAKLHMSLEEFTKTRNVLEQVNQEKMELESKVKSLEDSLEDQRAEEESVREKLVSKVRSLEGQIDGLQEELTSTQEQLHITQNSYDQALKEMKQEKSSVESELNEELHQRQKKEESLLNEKKLLEKSKSEMKNSLEKAESSIAKLEKNLESACCERDELKQKVSLLEGNVQEEKIAVRKQQELLQRERDSHKEAMDSVQKSMQENNKAKNDLISDIRSERDSLQNELEKMKESSQYEDDERRTHSEQLHATEELTRQLESDNRELARQLSDKLVQCQHLDEQMRKEKNRQIGYYRLMFSTADDNKLDKSNEEIQRVHYEIDTANERIRQLRDELQTKQSTVTKLQMEAVSQEAKHETVLHKMQREFNDLKLQHHRELDTMTEKLEGTQKEVKELYNVLREKDQELVRYEHETKRAKGTAERFENQLQAEIKQRTELEQKNTALEHDIGKVWAQVKTMMEKLNNLENAKRSLEEELDRKSTSCKQTEEFYTKKSASQETSVITYRNRADLAEHKVEKLQADLTEAVVKLQATEKQLFDTSIAKSNYQEKHGEMSDLRRNLHETHIQRTILEQTVNELKQQVAILKQRERKAMEQNSDLQHLMIDLESKVNEMRDRSQLAQEQPREAKLDSPRQTKQVELGRKTLTEQIATLQKDIEALQFELQVANEKRDIWERRYEERKVRTKSKLMKAREFYGGERRKLREQLSKIGEDLRLTRATLNKELEWKEKIEQGHKHLLSEKRDLLTQLAEREETARDLNRQLSMTQVRLNYLEEENSRLQQRVDSLTRQKQSLDRMMKDYRLEKQKEMISRAFSPDPHLQSLTTAATSGLGNSVDSSWDHENLADAIAISRIPNMSRDQQINGFLSKGFHHGGMEFSGSERSYDFNQEFDA